MLVGMSEPKVESAQPRNGARSLTAEELDPMAGVLSMGPRMPVALTVVLALLLHAGVAGAAGAAVVFAEIFTWNKALQETVFFKLAQTYEVEVEKEKEPEPPPPEEPKAETPPEEAPKPVAKEIPQDTPPPPPAAAAAAKVLATEPDPNEPVDMRDTMVQGTAETYAGGSTASTGTSKTAVTSAAAAATGVVGGTGTAPAPVVPKVDRSRKAGLLGSVDWSDCPFPAEADAEQIDSAYVTLQVKVFPDGRPEAVTITQDPGHGFGREARKCAMGKKFQGALDLDGNPIGATTNAFRIHFTR